MFGLNSLKSVSFNLEPSVFYKCLSDDTRLCILLLVQQKKELCVCELVDALALSQPKISRHLALLRNAHLLIDERREKWVYYRLNTQLPTWALHVIELTAEHNQHYLKQQLSRINDTSSKPLCD